LFNADMEFLVLGPLEVIDDGRPLQLGSRKQRALLALLLLHAGEIVPRERLIEELWHGKPPPTADATLRAYLSRLRSVLGAARVQTRTPGHVLLLAPEELDANLFERHLEAGRVALAEERPADAAQFLADALGLWRGDPLVDFVYEPFAQNEIARLSEFRLEALEERIEAELRLGRHEALVAELKELVPEHPLRERLCRQLMLALYRCGRQAEALGVYASTRRLLIDELGLEPGPELRAFERAVLRQDESLLLPRELEPPMSDVRKHVSVVAVLVSGDVIDPEAERMLTQQVVERSAPVLARNGGFVKRYPGAQLLAIFGIPELHEDDAVRATRAAYELLRDLADLGELRVGISSGEVLVSGSEVSGGPIEASLSLAVEAGGDEVRLDDETRELASLAVEIEPAGEVWRLAGVRAATRPRPPRGDTPFVGRRVLLERLQQRFQEVVEFRSCRMTTIVGDAGIGKSRLAIEFASQLPGEAAFVIAGCPSFGEGITFWPLRQLVHQLAGGADHARVRKLLAAEPDSDLVASRLASALEPSSSNTAIEELFLAARRLLESSARRCPLLVILEDLHWAEAAFLDLVENVAVAKAPLFLLCLARPEIHERRPGWGEGGETVDLAALESREAGQLLEAIGLQLPPRTNGRIVDAAQGNPLFLEQLAAAAAAGTSFDAALPLPPTLRALLAARLEQLGPAERALLQRAAIIGNDFSSAAAVELLPPDARASAERHRDALIDAGLLHFHAASGLTVDDCRFRHALIQEACYRSIPKQLRAELHEGFARWLEHHGSTLVELDEILGYHLERACLYRAQLGLAVSDDLRDLALGHLTTAGRRAIARQDYAAAGKLLDRAVALLSAGDVDVPLRIDLAHSLFFSGRPEEAYRSLAGVAEQAAAAGDRIGELCARIEEAILRFHVEPLGALERLTTLTEEALPLFEAAADDFALHLVHYGRAQIAHHQTRWDTELVEVERARLHARKTGLPHLEGWANELLAVARFYGSTPFSELLAWLDQRDAEGIQHLDFKGYRAASLAYLGRIDEARTLDAEMRREHADRGAQMFLAGWESQEATLLELLAGDPAAAAARAEEGCRFLEAAGERSLLSTGACYLAEALYALDRLDEAEAWVAKGVELGATDDVTTQLLARRVQAKLLARVSRHKEANAIAQEAVAISNETESPIRQADAYADLAEVLELADRHDEAAAALREALERYERKEAIVPARQVRERLTAATT
jgi:DNA-binding SARP family transcriptional activator